MDRKWPITPSSIYMTFSPIWLFLHRLLLLIFLPPFSPVLFKKTLNCNKTAIPKVSLWSTLGVLFNSWWHGKLANQTTVDGVWLELTVCYVHLVEGLMLSMCWKSSLMRQRLISKYSMLYKTSLEALNVVNVVVARSQHVKVSDFRSCFKIF